jgi:NarL family two-component system response regulator LiaR
MNERTIRILVVDDHEVVRKGIRSLLATEAEMQVVGEASNGREAIELAETLRPDVIIMDLVMPEVDGLEAIGRIRSRHPRCRILVLTSFGGDHKLFPALKAGAVGYLLKDTSPEDLIRAIRNAAAGRTSLHPAVARRLLIEFSHDSENHRPAEPLTAREIELIRRLARGHTNEQIAEELHISEATVRTHVSHILGKLNLTNRTQAALYALREGLASLDDVTS